MTSHVEETDGMTPHAAAYPIAVIQDRYGGSYSGGAWIAINMADHRENGTYRIVRCLEGGPSDDDVSAQSFWQDPPDWLAVGASPDEAVQVLRQKIGAPSDEAILAGIDRKVDEGRADIEAGRTRSIDDIRATMRQRYGRPVAAE